MVNGFKALLFVTVTGIMAASCVKGDNPIQRYEDPRNQGQGGVPVLGAGWTKVTIPKNAVDVDFVNDTLGFLAAGDGVYRSTNGGLNWSKTDATPNLDYITLFSLDEKTIWAVSGSKAISKTVDSGKTWVTLTASFNFTEVFFRDENNGFASSLEGVLKTTDGGSTWSLISNQPTGAASVYFSDELTGFCGTYENGYWRTDNGGTSFSRVTGLPSRIFTTQFFSGADAGKGITMGQDGYTYTSTDNGVTWTKGSKYNDVTYFDFQFKDMNNGFVMTDNNVFKIEENSVSKVLYRPKGPGIQFIECDFNADQTKGWVVFNDGELYRYVKP